MAQETMHMMIGRALTDRQFREDLLSSPREATRDLPLTSQERELIASLHAASLEEFSRKLNERLPESRERRHYAGAGAAAWATARSSGLPNVPDRIRR